MIKIEFDESDGKFYATGEDEDFKCSDCKKKIEEGFICRERGLILCTDCNEKMFEQPYYVVDEIPIQGVSEVAKLCPKDSNGCHNHIFFTKK